MPQTHTSRAARRSLAGLDDTYIPEKLYFRIGEVSKLTHTQAYVLRYWETEFPTLRPNKSSTGHRLYRRRDVETVLEIRRLLYGQGFTIEGARKKLAGDGSPGRERSKQKALFQGSTNGSELRTIRRELQGILTLLSRKC